jgi:hypothetical protein
VGFEPTISAGERPKTYALDRAANGTGGFCMVPQHNNVAGIVIRTLITVRAAWVRSRFSIPSRGKRYFSFPKHPDRFGTQLDVQWVPRTFPPKSKAVAAWSLPITSTQCWGKKWMEWYLYAFICLLAVHWNHLHFVKIRSYLPIINIKITTSFSGKTLHRFEVQQVCQVGDLTRYLSERRLVHSNCTVNT